MNLYTLTNNFFPKHFVTDLVSAIWTERYSSAGDVQIVVPAEAYQIAQLAPGTLIGLRGTKEIMLLETRSIENGLLTVNGSSLVKFLNEREAWFKNPLYGTVLTDAGEIDTSVPLTLDLTVNDTTAGQLIAWVVAIMSISPAVFDSYWAPLNLDWANDKIPGLEMGLIDANGPTKTLTFKQGPIYDGIVQLATDEGVGFKLYLESSNYSTGTYVLKFCTYRGKDRTGNRPDIRMVRLSPDLDSLNDPKELASVSKYKNVVYVTYKNVITTHYDKFSGGVAPTGFNRRVLRVDAPDIYQDDDHIAAFREQVAQNTFVDNLYIQTVDGQVPSKIPYTYGKDYSLGDIVVLEGPTGFLFNVRVTEYIRSQDQYGEKEFPTLAAIDPLKTGYMPDPEPDDGWDAPWGGDPDYPWDDVGSDDPVHKPDKPDEGPTEDPKPPFDGGGTGGDGTGPPFPEGSFAVVGFYPDQDKGQALGFIAFGTDEITTAWIYSPQDPDPEAYNYWQDLYPKGWTLDHQIIVLSVESKDSTPGYPWNQGFTFWLVGGVDGKEHFRVTDTYSTMSFPESVGYASYINPALWVGSAVGTDIELHWYINKTYSPAEYIYADGTYSSRADLHSYHIDYSVIPEGVLIRDYPLVDDPGPIVAVGEPAEIYHNTTGKIADFEKLFSVLDFPDNSRWSTSDIQPSPDGSRLYLERGGFAPRSGSWYIPGTTLPSYAGDPHPPLNPVELGDTFGIRIGLYGSNGWVQTPNIPNTATAEEVWTAVFQVQYSLFGEYPYLQDPRDHGYPYVPYGGGPLPLNQVNLQFHVVPETGIWLDIDNHDLIHQSWNVISIVSTNNWADSGAASHRYICNSDGSGLTAIDFGDVKFSFSPTWTPDSAKLCGIANSSAGEPYTRLFVYDVASGDVSFPLDYSDQVNTDGYGPLYRVYVSPNGQKIAWLLFDTTGGAIPYTALWVAHIDGSGAVKIYETPSAPDENDQDTMFLSGFITWSFDSKKLLIIDNRDPAPIWVFNTVTGALTKVFAGTGWDNPADQKWIYDPITFDG
jgi:hypothetical protein